MNKHTPGPWMANGKTIKTDFRHIGLGADAGVLIGSVGGGKTSGPSWPESDDEVYANARLIVAAPDLLEAIAELLALHDMKEAATARDLSDEYYGRMPFAIDAARAAYAKATGA